MSKAEEIFNKVNAMPLKDLMILCSNAIDMKMEKTRLDALLLILETKLRLRRIADLRGLKDEGAL